MARIRDLLPTEGRFGTLLGVTLWFVGLLVALMTGMLSGYLLATVVFVGSKAYGRIRSAGERGKLGTGDTV